MAENMKKFGLEFVLEDRSKNAYNTLIQNQRKLEKQLNASVKAFNKFQSTVNNTKLDNSSKKMDKLTNSITKYNNAMKVAGSQKLSGNAINSSGGSSAMQSMMGADYYRDMTSNIAQSLGSAFDSIPFGGIISPIVSNSLDGIVTSVMTGNIAPAIVGMISGGVESAMNIYRSSSEFVHSAIFGAFQKGSQLIVQALTTFIPQTLQRGYDQTKLGAVLGDDNLASQLSQMGVEYAKNSSLSLQDMDFILPNLVMANKSSGLKNEDMLETLRTQMEAITRLNFKDSGQGAGVQGSLVAIQEMLSGDYISLQRRFEMSGASIDRLKEAGEKGVNSQMLQLIEELERMGVTDEALKKMQESTKFKMDFIGESLTDFFTNPDTGIMASFIKPFEPVIDQISQLFDSGSSSLVAIKDGLSIAFGTLGDTILSLGEGIYNGFIARVDWETFLANTQGLMTTVSGYFEPAFTILADWVNATFIPWISDMNTKLQDPVIKEGILEYIEGLTEMATNTLNLVGHIIDNLPTINSVIGAVNSFVSAVSSVVSVVVGAFELAKTLLEKVASMKNIVSSGGSKNEDANTGKNTTGNDRTIEKKAIGMPYVPRDDYPVLLHKGERVLTAQQNRQFDQNTGATISKLADTLVVREDADIDKIANKLVAKLNEAKLGYGGAY